MNRQVNQMQVLFKSEELKKKKKKKNRKELKN